MTALRRSTDDNTRLITMLVVAALLHVLVLLGIGFEPPRPPAPRAEHSLDVILVPPKPTPERKAEDADFLSNASQEGGTDVPGRERPPALPSRPALERSEQPKASLEPAGAPATESRPAPRIITHQARRKPQPKPKPKPVPAKPKPDMAQLLASTRQEIARLTAELDRDSRYAAQKPRRKAINASTKEYRYAAYLEAWRKKVERVGNLNYPDAAKRKKLYGDLLLHVAVRADGTVAEIRVLRSSGHKILDDAAVRIVRLAAPFAPFPEEIRKEVDILDITRTWQFLSNNRLFSK